MYPTVIDSRPMKRRSGVNAASLALVVFSFMFASCHEDGPLNPPRIYEPGPILFVSNKTGTFQLYSMNEDGSSVKQLTYNTAFPIDDAIWSPDGKRIALTSPFEGIPSYGPAIYVMNADGSGIRKLTNAVPGEPNFTTGDQPAWSPDGKNIAFRRLMAPDLLGNTDLFIIGADGSSERKLTNTRDTAENVGCWSPDGRYLYFYYADYSRVDSNGASIENSTLARFDLMTDSSESLSPRQEDESGPLINPAGSRMVFSRLTAFGGAYGRQLYVRGLADTSARKLTVSQYKYESAAAWSPDGKKILYNGENDSQIPYQNPPREILVIDCDGSNLRNITPFDFREAISFATSWRRG